MTSILGRIFGSAKPPPLPAPGDLAFDRVMDKSDEIMRRMRECSESTDVARALMADIWFQNNNIPFLVTVFETVQEVKTGPEQMAASKRKP